MLQLRHLKTFLAAADTLSFTQAASRVHLSQPSVTEQIRALEDSVGQALFSRHNNRLSLTPAGHALTTRARELLALADQALLSLRTGADASAGGTIRLAAPPALCAGLLAPLWADYAQTHPGIHVQMLERHSQGTAEAVADGSADLGLVHGWPDARLQAKVLAHDRPMVLLPAGHALATEARVPLALLATQPLLLTSTGCTYRRYLDGLLQQADVRPVVRAEADGVPSLLRMVAQGLGVSVLPARAIALAAADSAVVARPLADSLQGLPICTLVRAETALPAAAFLALLLGQASDEAVPAFDLQHGSRGEAVAEQKEDGVRDVLWRSHAAHR